MLLDPEKSIRQCKDKIRNPKDTYKQAKDNSKRSRSVPQTSAYFNDLDQVLEARDGISLGTIHKVRTPKFCDFQAPLPLSESNRIRQTNSQLCVYMSSPFRGFLTTKNSS